MPIAAVVAIGIVAALLAYGVWDLYQARGKVEASTSLREDELVRQAVDFFALDGWNVRHQASDYVILDRRPSPLSALVLLIIFLPVGLVYLLTDWGRGKLALAYRPGSDGATEFQFTWRSAPLRGRVGRFLASTSARRLA